MIYRDATRDDLTAIDTLFRRSFTETFGHLYDPVDLAAFFARLTLAGWREEFDRPDVSIRLAYRADTLVGFAKTGTLLLPVAPRGPARELRQLYLDESAKGSGAGQALLDWAVHHARDAGAGELFLSVYVDNARARRFYERAGFERVGRYTFMVGTHEDEDDLMRLML